MKAFVVILLATLAAVQSAPDPPCPLDIIFSIDISGSVEEEFKYEKQFAEIVINELNDPALRSGLVKVGMVTFSGTAQVLSPLGSITSKAGLLNALNRINQVGGSTSAVSSMRLMIPEIQATKRNESQLMVIHISDGNSQDLLPTMEAEAKKLLDTGAVVYSVTFSDDAYRPELEAIAGDKRRVYAGAEELQKNFRPAIEAAAQNKFCERVRLPAGAKPKVIPESVNECKIDLMLILDTSGSVESEFQEQRQYLENIVAYADDEQYQFSSVALVTFDTSAKLVLPFKEGRSKSELVNTIKAIPFTGGGTSGVAGVTAAIAEINRGRRSDAILLVVHMSDGNSGISDTFDLVQKTADALHATNAEVFCVTQSPDYYRPELETYAGRKDRVYVSGDGEKFQADIVPVAFPESCKTEQGACPVNLLVILDRSGSVKDDFERQRDYAIEVLDQINPQHFKTNMKTAVVSFNNQANLDLKFTDSNRKADVIKTIKDIQITGGMTSAVAAMNVAIRELNTVKNEKARLMVLHVSDGNSQDLLSLTQSTSDRLKETGAEVWAATLSPQPYLYELQIISRDLRKVATTASQRDQFKQTFLNAVNSDLCLRETPKEKPNVDKCKVDLVINLDVSGSVEEEYIKERDFVIDTLNYPTDEWFTNDQIRFLIIKFTTSAQVVWPLTKKGTRQDIIDAVNAIKFEGGGTSALSAVNLELSELARSARSNARLITLHISDGNSGQSDTFDKVEAAAKALHDAGSTTFAMTYSPDYYMPELKTYTGSEDRVFVDGRETQLADAAIKVIKDGCPSFGTRR